VTGEALLEVAGREVAVTSPDKELFPERGETKLDLVQYYLAVSEPLLELHERDRTGGLMNAPWPPVYPKQPDEPPRVAPSRPKKS